MDKELLSRRLGVIFTLLFVVAMLFYMVPKLGPDVTIAFSAYRRCKEAIETQLTAPTTAQFPSYTEALLDKEGAIHHFAGLVEITNDTDAPIQLAFVCDIEASVSIGDNIIVASVGSPKTLSHSSR